MSVHSSLPFPRLSKSRFVAGVQCHKLLWLKVHEPQAIELQPDIVLQDLFGQGRQVGQLATELFPNGRSIELDYRDLPRAVEDTRAALDDGARCIFEASFFEHRTFVAVDVLEEQDDGWRLIEVKSSTRQKDEHIPDAAVQKYVLGQAGLDVINCEILHLNREFRHPDQGDLFQSTDVTDPVDHRLPQIPEEIDSQLEMLAGPCPDVEIGSHCYDPRACPFLERCWPQDRNHIKKLYRAGPKSVGRWFQRGIHWISDIPADERLPSAATRQLRAMAEDKIVVEPGLAEALVPFNCKLGFLDFETIARAVPVWPGMAPWGQAAAQFSYHETNGDGTYSHTEFLAEGPADARPILAEAMLEATKGAERVLMYTSFEKTQIRNLQKAVPDLASELEELESKLIDLHPVIRDYVYHPAFEGSFSLKYILHPLVPDLTYEDLVIIDGMVASVEIARLLFVSGKIPEHQREKTRKDLLEYCKRDTLATVRVLERLRELAEES